MKPADPDRLNARPPGQRGATCAYAEPQARREPSLLLQGNASKNAARTVASWPTSAVTAERCSSWSCWCWLIRTGVGQHPATV